MYAIIRTGGKQYRVRQGETLRVETLKGEVGDKVDLTDVLAVGEGDSVKIGTPLVDGAKVSATIKTHGRDKKIIVFKKIRRENYQRKQGHRQNFTELVIDSISA